MLLKKAELMQKQQVSNWKMEYTFPMKGGRYMLIMQHG